MIRAGEKSQHRFWRAAIQLAVVALVVRASIPLGYMPGNLLAGDFAVLCPTGIPAEFMQAISGHAHHHAGHTIDADRDCPIGSALQPAWAPNDWQVPAVDAIREEFNASLVFRPHSRQPESRYLARAPPLL